LFLTKDSGRIVSVMLFVEGGELLVLISRVASGMLIASASAGS